MDRVVEWPDLNHALAGNKYTLESFLKEIEVSFDLDGKRITGNLHYIPIDNNTGTPDLSSFAEYIMGKLISFCIPSSEIEAIKAAAEDEGTAFRDVTKAAYDTLRAVSSPRNGKANSSGEIGELILFILIEGILGAPAVAAKPALKMSAQDPVKGSDGVHIGFDGKDVCIYYGESKLSTKLDYCIRKSASSIQEYHNDSSKKNRDLAIVSKNLDLRLPEDKKKSIEDELQYYLNPMHRRNKSRSYKEVNACFLGFNHTVYNRLEGIPLQERAAWLHTEIEKEFPSILKKISKSLESNNISDYCIHYFLIPFADVQELQELCEKDIKPPSFVNRAQK